MDILEELLNLLELMRPPDPRRKPPKSMTAAACFNDAELVKQFLAAGGDVNETTSRGSPLSYAVARGNLELVNLLITAGAKDPGSNIGAAAARGDLPMMRRLFEAGVGLEKDGEPALASAAYRNQVEAVKLLLEKGARVEANNYHAVSEAARNAAIDVLRVFLPPGSSRNTQAGR